MTIKTRFLTQVAAATCDAEIDAAVDQAVRAVASNATTAQIAAALAAVPSADDRRAIGKIFGVEVARA
jgi:hypothetical protein